MNAVYERKYDIRTLDLDRFGNLKPSAILDLFQDAAGRQTALWGCDADDLRDRGLYWVLASVRFETVGKMNGAETILIRTAPLKSSGVKFFRDHIIENADGMPLVKARSLWAIIDSKTKRISVQKPYPDDLSYIDLFSPDFKMTKIIGLEPLKHLGAVGTRFTDADFNGHVNNAKYADIILDALFSSGAYNGGAIKSFGIDYLKETKIGEKLDIFLSRSGERFQITGKNESGIAHFISEIVFDER